jgi:hypothetical protein
MVSALGCARRKQVTDERRAEGWVRRSALTSSGLPKQNPVVVSRWLGVPAKRRLPGRALTGDVAT